MISHLVVIVVFNNVGGGGGLEAGWGFSAWVEADDRVVLFDTGADGDVLMHNLAVLGLDPKLVDAVVLSHPHYDHTGGLAQFLAHARAGIPVFVPAGARDLFRSAAPEARLVEIDGPKELFPALWTTGPLSGTYRGAAIPEQALALRTKEGVVVITGCAHPGVVEITRKVKELFPNDTIALLAGGFHLIGVDSERIKAIADSLSALGVVRIAPSHCTGEMAEGIFRKMWGKDFVELGLGDKFVLPQNLGDETR